MPGDREQSIISPNYHPYHQPTDVIDVTLRKMALDKIWWSCHTSLAFWPWTTGIHFLNVQEFSSIKIKLFINFIDFIHFSVIDNSNPREYVLAAV